MPSSQMTHSRTRLRVICNPAAGGSRKGMTAVLEHLPAMGVRYDLVQTAGPGDATRIAREAEAEQACDAVVVAGGDGTINEAALGLLDTAMPLGIIPSGTANVLAKEIALPRSPARLARALVHGPAVPVHLGQAGTHSFLMMAGAGFDARVVSEVTPVLKRRWGRWAYVLRALRHILRTTPERIEVEWDGESSSADWVIVANGSRYGGNYRVAPRADLRTPGFEVLMFQGRTAPERAANALALLLRHLGWNGGAVTRTARRLVLKGRPGEPLQVDGDAAGTLPVEITLSPHRVNLIHPAF